MQDLIERLEKAEGPDRELDALIHREVCKRLIADETIVAYIGPGGTTRTLTYVYPYRWALWFCPKYTGSMDAAVRLVPEGDRWMLMNAGFAHVAEVGEGGIEQIDHLSPAIALCIAALKAREAVSGC